MTLVPRFVRRVPPWIAALPLLASVARAGGPDDSGAPRLAAWSWEITPAHKAIAAALRDSRLPSPPPDSRLVDRIVSAGPGTIAAELDILVRKRVPEARPGDAPQILSDPQRALLIAALSRGSASAVRAAVGARVDAAPGDPGTQLAAVHALGAVGAAGDLRKIVELVPRKSGASSPLSTEAREAVKAACEAILLRDRDAYGALKDMMHRIDPEVGRPLLDALGSTRNPRALEVLREAARSQATLRPQVAAMAAKCGVSNDAAVDREFTSWLESELKEARPEYARVILQALGALDDGACVPTLIARLEDPDRGIADSALWGLKKISGLGFPALPASWNAWYLAETSWHDRVRPRLQQNLVSGDTARIVEALRGYAEHRTHRAQLAADVEAVLSDRRPELRHMACGTLGQIGSMNSCLALVGVLEDEDPSVSRAAREALTAITGLQIPDDAVRARSLFQSP